MVNYLLFLKKATIFKQKTLEVKTVEQTALLFDRLSPKMSLQIIEKYKTRMDGIMTSIKGKKSSLRPEHHKPHV